LLITALVLAAGQSHRMGSPKMLLPWGNTTVIGQVISTLWQAKMTDIRIVTGANQDEIKHLISDKHVKFVFNSEYANGEMLISAQVGLSSLGEAVNAAIIVLGDQPQIQAQTIQLIVDAYLSRGSTLIVPSYQLRRGHPWLIDRSLWDVVLNLKPPDTLRDFLSRHNNVIDYINVESASVILDMDTPDEYQRFKP
jgi:molybdenum cofactor cytidylyltransferase